MVSAIRPHPKKGFPFYVPNLPTTDHVRVADVNRITLGWLTESTLYYKLQHSLQLQSCSLSFAQILEVKIQRARGNYIPGTSLKPSQLAGWGGKKYKVQVALSTYKLRLAHHSGSPEEEDTDVTVNSNTTAGHPEARGRTVLAGHGALRRNNADKPHTSRKSFLPYFDWRNNL